MIGLLMLVVLFLLVSVLLLRPRSGAYATLVATLALFIALYALLLGYINAVEALILGAAALLLLLGIRTRR